MDWQESVTIPSGMVSHARRFAFLLRTSLWIATNSLYLVIALLMLFGWAAWRWRTRARKRTL
jgi:hypothetical protein